MPWGRYKHQNFRGIPAEYLAWVYSGNYAGEELKERIRSFLKDTLDAEEDYDEGGIGSPEQSSQEGDTPEEERPGKEDTSWLF